MNTLTIILIIYVIFDIIVDTTFYIYIRKRGFTLSSFASHLRQIRNNKW